MSIGTLTWTRSPPRSSTRTCTHMSAAEAAVAKARPTNRAGIRMACRMASSPRRFLTFPPRKGKDWSIR